MSGLVQLSEWTVLIAAFLGLVVIMGASLYDMIAISRRRRLDDVRQSRLPHVTVLVYAQESQAVVAACLESIEHNQYPHYDIVVVDNATVSAARRAVTVYRQQHPTRVIYFYGKRKTTDRLSALRAGYKKSQRGELVCVIDATNTLELRTLHRCAARFATETSLQALWLREHLHGEASISLLLRRSMNVSQTLYYKCRSLLFEKHVCAAESGVFSRQEAFLRHATLPGVYESTVWMTRQPVQYDNAMFPPVLPRMDVVSRSTLWRSLRVMGVFYSLFLVTYFLYTAANLQSSSLLMLSWAASSIWFAVGIWSDESATWLEKIAFSFCLPMLYFLVYGYLVMMLIVVVIKAIFRMLHLLNRQLTTLYRTAPYSR